MKNNKSNIFGGILLIVFGILMFGLVNDLFDFELTLKSIAKYWPLLIVLGGVAVFFNNRRTVYNSTTALLVAFAIPLGIYHESTKAIDNVKSEIEESINIDLDDDSDYEDTDTTLSTTTNEAFNVALNPGTKLAKLNFTGGGAEFGLSESGSGNLFESVADKIGNGYEISDEKNGETQEVDFKMKKFNQKYSFNSNSKFGKVIFKLNKRPIWDIDMELGAGSVKFDFSDYYIKNLKLSAGMTGMDIKLGQKYNDTRVKVESGMTMIKLRVPASSACEIVTESGLSINDFEGFTKLENGKWRSKDYEKHNNKITIELETGASKTTIERY